MRDKYCRIHALTYILYAVISLSLFLLACDFLFQVSFALWSTILDIVNARQKPSYSQLYNRSIIHHPPPHNHHGNLPPSPRSHRPPQRPPKLRNRDRRHRTTRLHRTPKRRLQSPPRINTASPLTNTSIIIITVNINTSSTDPTARILPLGLLATTHVTLPPQPQPQPRPRRLRLPKLPPPALSLQNRTTAAAAAASEPFQRKPDRPFDAAGSGSCSCISLGNRAGRGDGDGDGE